MKAPRKLVSGLIAVSLSAIGALAEDANVDPRALYDAHVRGIELYEAGEYEKAYPDLVTGSEAGFKQSQVRLGALYLYGLGVDRSDLKALAWLGTAARDDDEDIRQAFDTVWQKVPSEAAPRVTAVIDQYIERYGVDPMENCKKSRQAGSHISKSTCIFGDKYDTLLELEREMANQATIGTRRPGGELTADGFGGGGVGPGGP